MTDNDLVLTALDPYRPMIARIHARSVLDETENNGDEMTKSTGGGPDDWQEGADGYTRALVGLPPTAANAVGGRRSRNSHGNLALARMALWVTAHNLGFHT